MEAPERWRRCSTCKTEIPFEGRHWVCRVSTCNQKRTGLVFCSVSCCEAHDSILNHRDPGALERRAPTRAEWAREQAATSAASAAAAVRRPAAPGSAHSASTPRADERASASRAADPAPVSNELAPVAEREILVVTSKLKQYVRARSGMNTSDAVMEVLSERLRTLCDRAIRNARRDGRKTVLDRDFS